MFSSTWLIDPAESMPGVVFFRLETGFTKIKVITISTFESGSIDRESLATITPVFKIDNKKRSRSFLIIFKENSSSLN